MSDLTVDFVVVGAGTAGCVLAARLAQDQQTSVALIESGGMDTNSVIYAPGLNPMFSLWGAQSAENWGYKTAPQPALYGRSIEVARGRVLGGSSAINAMIYIRGNRRDFDDWSRLGNAGWGYEAVLPAFKKSEAYQGGPSPYHGDAGPISVIDYQHPSPVGHAFVEAAASLGATQTYNDFNGAAQEAGAGFYQSTRTAAGVRVTAASAFVKPMLGQSNITLLSNTRARRVLIERGRACGLEYVDSEERPATIRARREVLVCCGAFETPKLLMLSGLGPAAELTRHGIEVVADIPEVGRNLQDHMLFGVGYESLVPLEAPELLAEAGLFTWTGVGSRQASPDLQYFVGPVQFVAPEYMTNGPGFTLAPILAQPRSRGTVTLASNDPTARAHVDPQYLTDDDDLAVLEYGLRFARELAHTSSFAALRGRELAPGAAVTSSADLRDYIRKVAGTVWHPAGTCRMGSDQASVVDDRLRVRGIEGLRVADASVMPKLVNGNPNAAVMMIAEQAAAFIQSGKTVIERVAALAS